MDIDKLEAGREMDVAIQRDIFKTKVWFRKGKPTTYLHETDDYDGIIPHYSTDIAAAWLVVEKMRLRYRVDICAYVATGWKAIDGVTVKVYSTDIENFEVNADTAPLAICRAALKALDRA